MLLLIPCRLIGRTPGFEPENTGSRPVGGSRAISLIGKTGGYELPNKGSTPLLLSIYGVCSLTGKALDCESRRCEFESHRSPKSFVHVT